MSERYIIGIDIGTTGTKAILFREDGTPIAHAYRGYTLSTPAVGRSEHDAESYVNAVAETVREVCEGREISDRVAAILAMLKALGGNAEATDDTLTVYPGQLTGGTVDACNDHRIAMSAAIAATVCSQDVTLIGAEAVKKSYPQFWDEYSRLGGNYELYLR